MLDGLYFGKYPTEAEANALNFVDLFVDLTAEDEQLPGYPLGRAEKWRFPIADHRVPPDAAEFRAFLSRVEAEWKAGRTLYVHCRGGHGRAGLAVACLLKLRGYSSAEALALVKRAHAERQTWKPEWRRRGAPQILAQKRFVRSFV